MGVRPLVAVVPVNVGAVRYEPGQELPEVGVDAVRLLRLGAAVEAPAPAGAGAPSGSGAGGAAKRRRRAKTAG